MAWVVGNVGTAVDEEEGPGHIGDAAYYLGVHQVAQADEAGGGAGSDGDIVEHGPHLDTGMLAVEQQGEDESQRAAMRGQSLVARHVPVTIGRKPDGQQHLDDVLA